MSTSFKPSLLPPPHTTNLTTNLLKLWSPFWVTSLVTWSRWLVCVMNGNKLNEILVAWLITQGWGRLHFFLVRLFAGKIRGWKSTRLYGNYFIPAMKYIRIPSLKPTRIRWKVLDPVFFFRWLKWEVEWSVETPGDWRLELHVSSHEKEGISQPEKVAVSKAIRCPFKKMVLVGGHVSFRGVCWKSWKRGKCSRR